MKHGWFVRMKQRSGFNRGSGTRNAADLTRLLLRIPRSTPEHDVDAMSGGAPLAVSAIRRTHSGWRYGYLSMSLSEEPPLWWESRRGETLDVPPPIDVR